MARLQASIILNGRQVSLISLADESGYGALTSTTLGIARAHHKIHVRDYHLRAASQPGMRLCWPEAGLLDSLVHGGSSGHVRQHVGSRWCPC